MNRTSLLPGPGDDISSRKLFLQGMQYIETLCWTLFQLLGLQGIPFPYRHLSRKFKQEWSIKRQLRAIILAKLSYKHTKQFYEPTRTSSVLRRSPEMLLERAASGQSAHHMAARATCLDMCKYAYLDDIIRGENYIWRTIGRDSVTSTHNAR